MTGAWLRRFDTGDYIYDQGDGWWFDHRTQAWYYGEPPLAEPTGAPTGATVRRTTDELLEPINPFTPHLRREPGFFGLVAWVICWTMRAGLAYVAFWWLVHLPSIVMGGLRFTDNVGDALQTPQEHLDEQNFVWAFVLLLFVAFFITILGIFAANPTQSRAITALFVYLRMERRWANQQAEAYDRIAHRHGHH